jgi:hypothetical protein
MRPAGAVNPPNARSCHIDQFSRGAPGEQPGEVGAFLDTRISARCHNGSMKLALIACGVFLVGLILLAAMSNADFVPSGVRSVLNSVANIW